MHRFLAFILLFLTAAPAASAAPSTSSTVPILVYHHIRDTRPYPKSTWSWKMSVSPAVFDTQMQWIADHGYTTVTMDTAADILAGKRNDIAKPVVITFDDNNLTQYTLALPILEKYHQIAVFYLVTNRLANAGVIDAERAKDLHRRGMDVESHSVTHSTLTALSLKRLDQELVESKKTLEALLGKTVSHIAYPSTAHNKTVRAHAAAAGYVTGTIMDPRPAKGTDDLFKLPRIMMTDETRLERVLP